MLSEGVWIIDVVCVSEGSKYANACGVVICGQGHVEWH